MDGSNVEAQPFVVDVSESILDDLRERLARTRWVDRFEGAGWEYGVDLDYLQELCEYWRTQFDWSAAQARLNSFPQFITEVDGLRIHYLHARSPHPNALPMILTHGWPGSVAEFLSVIGPLTDPAAHGGDAADAFHVVAPSLPGFAFSGPTTAQGVNARVVAPAFAQIMARLGYGRYVAQGGDIGASISATLGEVDSEHVAAVHVNLIPVAPPVGVDPFVGLDAQDLARATATFQKLDGDTGYWKIQGTRPQTVASALNDSPAGLAGWIVDKFRSWTDCDGDVEREFTRDELLTNITIYWVTQTINSSARWYFENAGMRQVDPPACSVPTGYADFPGEHYRMPLAWARDCLNLVHVSTMPRGGHFAALQVPDLFVDELRQFFRRYRAH